MDIKSKKWKVIGSFLAFFLSVSLLIGGAAGLFSSVSANGRGIAALRDHFEKDYQNTAEFRGFVSDSLGTFLAMATGGPLGWDYSGNIVVEAAPGSTWAVEQGYSDYVYDEYDYSYYDYGETASPEDWKQQADQAHAYLKEDKNVLYKIARDGDTLYTNADNADLNGDWGSLPEGYNFMLYFDGKTVKIVKDGQELDVYGDGYYQEGDDWYVPGFKNFTVDERTSHVTVCVAIEQSPMIYVTGNYSSGGSASRHNELYWLERNLLHQRQRDLGSVIALALGLLLLAPFWLWRREKKEADKAIAQQTGRVWFECKAAVVLLAILATLLNSQIFLEEVYWGFQSGRFYSEMLLGAVGTLLTSPPTLLVLFWVMYLFINDLRHGEKPWKNSLCSRVVAALSVPDLRQPFQQRMVSRFRLVFAAEAIAGVAILLVCVWSMEPIVCLPLVALGAVAVAAQLLFVKSAEVVARDTGALVDQIAAIRGGNLAMPLELPQEADLYEAAQGLNNLQHGMSEALEEQIRSEHLKVELIANVSHDIKTPLTSIISYTELLREEEGLPDHVMDYIRILENKSQRLKAMVQDVFEVSKAASGQLPVLLENLDFGKLLRQTLADMSQRIEESAVVIKTEIPEEPLLIHADGQRLYRVFQNLLQNALQYSLEGSRVFVTLSASGSAAVASVKNTSKTEIPPNMDFTERFSRGDPSRTDGGSGLGLSIARNFTEACGGRFRVETIADLFVATVEFARVDRESED